MYLVKTNSIANTHNSVPTLVGSSVVEDSQSARDGLAKTC